KPDKIIITSNKCPCGVFSTQGRGSQELAMSNQQFTPSAFSRLSSIDLQRAIVDYETIAQAHFAKAQALKGNTQAVELHVRENERGRVAQAKANELRTVLALRKRERLARRRFVYKALEAQKLAEIALEGRA